MSYYDWTFGGLCLQNAGLVLRLVSWTFESLVSLITPHYPLRSPSWSTVLHFRCVRLSFQKKTRVSCCCFRVFLSGVDAGPQSKQLHLPKSSRPQSGSCARSPDRNTCAFARTTYVTARFCNFD